MYATSAWGQRTHTLSSSSWKVRSCTKRRPKAVGLLNTVQCYSCASCCESTWTKASCLKWLKSSLIFSHILATCFTYSGSNTWLIPQKVSASAWMWMLYSRRESCLFFFFFLNWISVGLVSKMFSLMGPKDQHKWQKGIRGGYILD